MISTPCYVTRESVNAASNVASSAYIDSLVDEAIESASRRVDRLTHRVFYPTVATRYFPWPDNRSSAPWELWLGQDELVSVSTLVSGGTTIVSSDYFLEPVNVGPPYTSIQIDRDSSAAFASAGTPQRAIAVTGTFGFQSLHTTVTTTTEALDDSETGVDVANSAAVNVGDLARVGVEYLLVTGKTMVDTTQNASALTAAKSDVSITGVTAGTVFVGETLLIDSERMLVQDVAGTTLTVQRAYSGSVLAAHALNADIYAPRTLTVIRAAQSTVAATHLTSSSVDLFNYPAPIRQLTRAYALDQIQQEGSAYARMVGSGEGERAASGRAIKDLEKSIKESAYSRRVRSVGV